MVNPSIMETLFQRTLEDLIKSLRLQPTDTNQIITKSLDEIKREIKSTDPQTKSTALEKLTFLSSIHHIDISWAAFHVVETMSSHSFKHKKIGYHAASISFSENTPVILLITNQLRKDLTSVNEFEVGLALECLGSIGNVDLCRDLTPEVFTLLGSTKVLVRKKAVAVLLSVFGKYPDSVRVCFKRLVENLESGESEVVSAAVGVFCELVVKDARSYMPLAPEFYKILVESKNNWVLIKVLKIFARLVPVEPRLGKKVVEPICEIMSRTGAVSLLFECIRTVVSCLDGYESAVKLAVAKNREVLLMSDDPNLKSLGLQAVLIIAPKQLWAVLESQEVVVKSLSNSDPNIKLGALRLLMAMVSESNLAEICRVLVNYALKSDPEFCNEILESILMTCSRNVYEIVVDFDWYGSLLGDMARIPHCQRGEEIEKQLIDIAMRVMDARPQLVRVSRDLLIDPALLGNPFIHNILSAAAWVSGEYVEFSKDPFELIESLLQPRTNLLPPSIRAIYIQSCFKVVVFCLQSYFLNKESAGSLFGPDGLNSEGSISLSNRDNAEDSAVTNEGQTSLSAGKASFTNESMSKMLNIVELALGPLTGSHELEVGERAQNVLALIDLVKVDIIDFSDQNEAETQESEAFKITKLVFDAFVEELGPVSISAQEKVPVPDGLILSDNLAELDTICGDVQLPPLNLLTFGGPQYGESIIGSLPDLQSKEESEPSETTSFLSEHRKRHGLYYLLSEKNEDESKEYPAANDPSSRDRPDDNSEDLLKITAQSLLPKKKSGNAKPRPVVVKLDEGDGVYISTKKAEQKEDLLSDAIRDVLLSNENLDKLSARKKGKEKVDVTMKSEENPVSEEKLDHRKSSTGRSKHHSHSKERRHKKSGKSRDENDGKGKHKSRHRHGRQRTQARAEGPSNVAEQTPVIPDFLL